MVLFYTKICFSLFFVASHIDPRSSSAMAFHGPVLSFQLPQFFNFNKARDQFDIEEKKRELFQSISNTGNGKNATPSQQRSILSLVRQIETNNPPPSTLYTDAAQIRILEGVWFLKYTSPSSIPDEDDQENDRADAATDADSTVGKAIGEAEEWTPTVGEDERIETRQIKSKGTVSAAGITVDVSSKDTKQILNFDEDGASLMNEVELDFATVVVGGSLRPSDRVYNRVVASFTECKITFNNGFVLDLGLLFAALSALRGTDESGWLETTYVDKDLRIGRGNKGTMFVLTREKDVVAS